MKRPLITLLTDFGLADHYVAAMKGVILGIARDAQLVDISHEIGAYGIAEAAFTLSQAVSWFPPGTVHLVVVDPGVGSSRRPIISRAGSQYFVAPDNGVLSLIWGSDPKARVWEISVAPRRLSSTFHGRDLFAPVAAQIAQGSSPGSLGRRIHDVQTLPIGSARQTGPNEWAGEILKIDRFGNVITSLPVALWPQVSTKSFVLRIGSRKIRKVRQVYSDGLPGELFVIAGSTGFLEIAAKEANAAIIMGGALKPGSSLNIKIN